MNRIKLLWKYFRNDRMLEYDNIIKQAVQNNYNVISMRDYIENNYDMSKKIFILRHDVDYIGKGTKKMFDIETKYSVKSSFYFRNSTYEPQLIKQIENYGSEASLHFESIADFIKANSNITSKEDLLSTDFKEKCLNILHCDLNRLRLLCNIPCVTIASHGEYENRLVGVPNNYLTEDITVYKYLEIKLEAYNKKFIEKINSYISDTPLSINNGYRYGVTPVESIQNNEKIILFLTHPNHWYLSLLQRLKVSIIVLLKGPSFTDSKFKRM